MTHNLSHDKNCVFYKTSIFLKMTAHARTLHRQKSPILATDKVTWAMALFIYLFFKTWSFIYFVLKWVGSIFYYIVPIFLTMTLLIMGSALV